MFGWKNWFGKHSSDIWNIAPLCLMWILWNEQNSRTFDISNFDWSCVCGLSSGNSLLSFRQMTPMEQLSSCIFSTIKD